MLSEKMRKSFVPTNLASRTTPKFNVPPSRKSHADGANSNASQALGQPSNSPSACAAAGSQSIDQTGLTLLAASIASILRRNFTMFGAWGSGRKPRVGPKARSGECWFRRLARG
jgi:hypothetical protein